MNVSVGTDYRIADNSFNRVLDLPPDWLFDDALSAIATAVVSTPSLSLTVEGALATASSTVPIFSLAVEFDPAIATAISTNPSVAIGVASAVALASPVLIVGVAVEYTPAIATATGTNPEFITSMNPDSAISTAVVTSPSVAITLESALAVATSPIVGVAISIESALATAFVTDPIFAIVFEAPAAVATAIVSEDMLVAQIPSIPNNFVALRSVDFLSVSLSWDTVAGATNYKVSRVDAYRGQDTVIRTEPNLSYIDSGLTAGTSYTYTVRAINEVMGVEGLRTLPVFTSGENETLS